MSTPNPEQSRVNPKQLLLDALEKRCEVYRTELRKCQSEFSEEAIHDLRVATRRILALIQLLSSIAARPRLKKMARAFKDQLDEFDEVRDTQVILIELAEILPEVPHFEEFEVHLRSHEEEMLQDLQKKLEQWDLSEIDSWIRETREDMETWGEKDLQYWILDAVDDAFLTVRQRLGWVDPARSATIHRVRVAFKAFRYMVEIAHPLVSDYPPGIQKQMNDYQTLMGNIQDAEVFVQTLTKYTGSSPMQDLEAIHTYYENRRTAAISAFNGARDKLFSFWRPAADRPFPWT